MINRRVRSIIWLPALAFSQRFARTTIYNERSRPRGADNDELRLEGMMQTSLVLYEVVEQVARLTLNHPEKRNALSRAMLQALRDRLAEAGRDPAVHAVILRGNGPVFSAGHDLRELVAASRTAATELFALCTEVMEAIRLLPRPVIAAVQGLATAAGCQLVATCDLVVATDTARFATPGVKIGLFCSTPGVALCRAVPTKKAMEMLLTGEAIDAREAERWGLVNQVVPPDQLDAAAHQLARRVIAASRTTLAVGKAAFYAQQALDVPAAYAVAQETMVENSQAVDAQEGMRAFLEKRPPRWQE
jgi:enoyl-CoA hydratase/carnithine racemase